MKIESNHTAASETQHVEQPGRRAPANCGLQSPKQELVSSPGWQWRITWGQRASIAMKHEGQSHLVNAHPLFGSDQPRRGEQFVGFLYVPNSPRDAANFHGPGRKVYVLNEAGNILASGTGHQDALDEAAKALFR
jgi:hypothetical protein